MKISSGPHPPTRGNSDAFQLQLPSSFIPADDCMNGLEPSKGNAVPRLQQMTAMGVLNSQRYGMRTTFAHPDCNSQPMTERDLNPQKCRCAIDIVNSSSAATATW